MRRLSALISILIISLMATKTFGQTTSVNINNSVNSSNSNSQTTTSTTHVRIETNGEVKEFNTDGNESVDWKSPDGKSSVKINNGSATVKTEDTDNKEINDDGGGEEDKKSSPSATPATPKDDVKSDDGNAFSILINFFKSIFSFL